MQAFAANGKPIGRADVVHRGRRARQWRVELAGVRCYVTSYRDALSELVKLGATRIDVPANLLSDQPGVLLPGSEP